MPWLENKRTFIDSAALLALIFLVLLTFHAPLLRLPYFWDEAGYYVPAAHDFFLTGSPIPKTTISNAHPPLVMAYLALWWKFFGFSQLVTRTAMLMMSAFALLGLFRMAQRVANTQVAVASILCTAVYPVFFSQSSLAHLDLAAAGLTFWGLKAYVEKRHTWTAIWFSLAVLTKETAILAPIGLGAWEIIRLLSKEKRDSRGKPRLHTVLGALIIPVIPLALWYGYHYLKTGFTFGNPEFLRYNVQATMHPLRIVLALLMRLWQTFGYMNLLLLTAAGILAMWRPPLYDQKTERPRIALEVQFAFLAVVTTYVIAMAVIGGAVLARYMLPAVPLVIVVFISTLWRRIAQWRWVVAVVVLGFVAGLFINPPYAFALEDNLAYRNFIQLHQDSEHYLESHYPRSNVLTAWPASDELTRPFLGYVSHPLHILRIEDFRVEQLMAAPDAQPHYDVAFVFSTKYEPPNPLLKDWPAWDRIKTRFFDYHHDVPPAVAAQILGGEIVFSETRKGQWVAVIEMRQMIEARNIR
ncbi:MAG TPA: glycosyltransferase family 39 protein [Terriglobales bacterium]|nr:glycosyltransferase family 39 protein [Terriglobales bacterium]